MGFVIEWDGKQDGIGNEDGIWGYASGGTMLCETAGDDLIRTVSLI